MELLPAYRPGRATDDPARLRFFPSPAHLPVLFSVRLDSLQSSLSSSRFDDDVRLPRETFLPSAQLSFRDEFQWLWAHTVILSLEYMIDPRALAPLVPPDRSFEGKSLDTSP